MTPVKSSLLCISLIVVLGSQATHCEDVDFNRDVRPILSDKCFYCHGPDSDNREADLRLDLRSAALHVIESGDLLDRITNEDDDLRMPPLESRLSLTDTEKETIRKWIAQGAEYRLHWAFELLPDQVVIPDVNDSAWCRQPIDQFVLSRLEQAGIRPASEASALRWFRRVTLDLSGLPPTEKEVRDFRAAETAASDRAREDVVDRLLDSPAFGEHLAVGWLDVARYADSYGYQSDKLNTQWPYRDWVVRAFNDNLPYDRFLTWQLAGDLLDDPTQDQLVATAFNRIHRLNNEGGAVFEEWRVENVADRVHTFGTAVLGLTMECCRCHDHKYDPIPMQDYYSLSAFFNSIDESGVYDRTAKVPCPSVLLPTPEQADVLRQAKENLRLAEVAYTRALTGAERRYKMWSGAGAKPMIPDLQLALGFDRPFDNSLKKIYHPSQSDRSWAPSLETVDVTDSMIAVLDPSSAADASEADPDVRRALKLDGERGVTTSGIEPFDRWLPMTVVVTLKETRRVPERSLIAHHTRGTDCGYNGWDLTIEDGFLESRMYRVWPGNAIGVRTVSPISANEWHQVAATYDGSSTAGGLKLYLNGQPLETIVLRDELKKSCNVVVDHGGEFVVGQRFRARGLDGGLIDDVRVFGRNLTGSELQYLASGSWPTERLKGYYVSTVDEIARNALAALTVARREFVQAEEHVVEIPVMREMAETRPAYVLARGQYDSPKNEDTRVRRRTLSGISLQLPDDVSPDRMSLAKWVTDPRHPLTARVAVNRLWGNFFADPLVRTPENFGSQGALPDNPELLNWLARDFVSHGWNVKRFCRQIVLSSTYRQDSAVSPDRLAMDPDNRMLSLGPAYRLSAEQIRDLVLASSGLLNRQSGGVPVSPYQPGADLWKESNGMSPPYQQSVGRSLYRRSLYSVWKRTAPLPNMMAFDATTREVCSVKRSRTNTPLQALVLLNDIQFVEACRVLAEGLLEEQNPLESAFIRMTGRLPYHDESRVLQQLLQDERAFYAAHPDEAKKLISVGDFRSATSVDPVELAAMTNVCQAILNLDATVWKR